jgi:N-acetylglutamate synthase-like GNAT family acetyltransferase
MGDNTDTDKITWRRGRLDDVPRFEELIAAADLPPLFIAEYIDGFVVGERDGAVIACGGVEMYQRCAVLRSVVVDESGRGLGVGRGLCDRLEQHARDAGATDIYLFTGDALEFWKRRGYVVTGLDGWATPPRMSWQYQFVSQNEDIVGEAHAMWRKA